MISVDMARTSQSWARIETGSGDWRFVHRMEVLRCDDFTELDRSELLATMDASPKQRRPVRGSTKTPCRVCGSVDPRGAYGYCPVHYRRLTRTGSVGPVELQHAKNYGTIIERLAQRVASGPGGCWLWTGAADKLGYGRVNVSGVTRSAHRVSYECYVAEIPDGLTIDHLCRVPACINPWHLEPVPNELNIQRAAEARRTQCGDR